MTARKHHFLSQFYLKGFARGPSKKSKLTVFDLEKREIFFSNPKGVAAKRDFNRLDVEGIEQNELENSLSKFESQAARAVRQLIDGDLLEGDVRSNILQMIVLFATRSPARRQTISSSIEELIQKIMLVSSQNDQVWSSQQRQFEQRTGEKLHLSAQDFREFVLGEKIKPEISREFLIGLELSLFDDMLDLLTLRKWLVVEANEDAGNFITSDLPVCLNWNDPEKVPLLHRSSPGFGLQNTTIVFPVSKRFALIGAFDGREGKVMAEKAFVSSINSIILQNAHKQLFADSPDFMIASANGDLQNSKKFFKDFKQN